MQIAVWIPVLSVSRLDSKLVTIKLVFYSHLDPNLVKQAFLNKTLNASSHWLGATYQLTDIHITGTK